MGVRSHRFVDDLAAQRPSPPEGFPDDLLDDISLLGEERAWTRAVTTPGSRVSHDGPFGEGCAPGWEPWTGRVIRGAKDPVGGFGPDGMVLVEHRYVDRYGVLEKAQRWYRALSLSPAASVAAIRRIR